MTASANAILDLVARVARDDAGKADCPPELIPAEDDLCLFLTRTEAGQAFQDASAALTALYGMRSMGGGTRDYASAWFPTVEYSKGVTIWLEESDNPEARMKIQIPQDDTHDLDLGSEPAVAAHVQRWIDAINRPDCYNPGLKGRRRLRVFLAPPTFEGYVLKEVCGSHRAAVLLDGDPGIQEAHAHWRALPPDERPEHPLLALVSAWQKWKEEQPIVRPINDRQDRGMPTKVAQGKNHRLFSPFMRAAEVADAAPGTQLVLPGWSATVDGLIMPMLPHALFDLGAGKVVKQVGDAAPLALRLWVESIRFVSMEDWGLDRPIVLIVDMRELLARLYPYRRPSPREYYPLLAAASDALDQGWLPYEDPATGLYRARRVVLVDDMPVYQEGQSILDAKIGLAVRLPPGSKEGPILSPNLHYWGVDSAVMYRLLLGIAFQWWEPGRTHTPVRRGKRVFWVQSDDPKNYKPLTDAQIARLCFPTSTIQQQRVKEHRARDMRQTAIETGEMREVDGKLLPPPAGSYTDQGWLEETAEKRKRWKKAGKKNHRR